MFALMANCAAKIRDWRDVQGAPKYET
jgi:hypothetical protein